MTMMVFDITDKPALHISYDNTLADVQLDLRPLIIVNIFSNASVTCVIKKPFPKIVFNS